MLSHTRKLITHFLLACLAIISVSCSKEEKEPAPKPISVAATVVQLEDVPLFIETTGKLGASGYVEVFPQVQGRLLKTLVREGASVDTGDALFQIDPFSYQVALCEVQARLTLDRVSLEAAQKKLARYEELSKKDLISQQEWDELIAAVAAAKAIVEQDQARVDSCQRKLDDCIIKAPISGRVSTIAWDDGDMIPAGTTKPLTTISTLDDVVVDFCLTEQEFNQLVRNRSLANISIDICSFCQHDAEKARGRVTFIDHTFHPQTGLLRMKGKISNGEWLFFPGQGVHVKIPVTVIRNAKVIPLRAVKLNQQGHYAFVIKSDNTVEQRSLTLGSEYGFQTIVADGLQEGERVVTDGHARLFPGALIEVKE